MSAAIELEQLRIVDRGAHCGPPRRPREPVLGPLHDERRTGDSRQQAARMMLVVVPGRGQAPPDHVAVGPLRPADPVLDLLGAVALTEHIGEERQRERGPIPDLVVATGVGTVAELQVRRDQHERSHSLGVLDGELEVVTRVTPGDDDRSIDCRRVEHADRVTSPLRAVVAGDRCRSVAASVAARVERDHRERARQERDLGLPAARVHDLPARHQQDRPGPRAVSLPGDPDPVAPDKPGLVGEPSTPAGLGQRGAVGRHPGSSTVVRSSCSVLHGDRQRLDERAQFEVEPHRITRLWTVTGSRLIAVLLGWLSPSLSPIIADRIRGPPSGLPLVD